MSWDDEQYIDTYTTFLYQPKDLELLPGSKKRNAIVARVVAEEVYNDVKPNDMILAVNGSPCRDLSFEQIIKMIRQARAKTHEPVELKLERPLEESDEVDVRQIIWLATHEVHRDP